MDRSYESSIVSFDGVRAIARGKDVGDALEALFASFPANPGEGVVNSDLSITLRFDRLSGKNIRELLIHALSKRTIDLPRGEESISRCLIQTKTTYHGLNPRQMIRRNCVSLDGGSICLIDDPDTTYLVNRAIIYPNRNVTKSFPTILLNEEIEPGEDIRWSSMYAAISLEVPFNDKWTINATIKTKLNPSSRDRQIREFYNDLGIVDVDTFGSSIASHGSPGAVSSASSASAGAVSSASSKYLLQFNITSTTDGSSVSLEDVSTMLYRNLKLHKEDNIFPLQGSNVKLLWNILQSNTRYMTRRKRRVLDQKNGESKLLVSSIYKRPKQATKRDLLSIAMQNVWGLAIDRGETEIILLRKKGRTVTTHRFTDITYFTGSIRSTRSIPTGYTLLVTEKSGSINQVFDIHLLGGKDQTRRSYNRRKETYESFVSSNSKLLERAGIHLVAPESILLTEDNFADSIKRLHSPMKDVLLINAKKRYTGDRYTRYVGRNSMPTSFIAKKIHSSANEYILYTIIEPALRKYITSSSSGALQGEGLSSGACLSSGAFETVSLPNSHILHISPADASSMITRGKEFIHFNSDTLNDVVLLCRWTADGWNDVQIDIDKTITYRQGMVDNIDHYLDAMTNLIVSLERYSITKVDDLSSPMSYESLASGKVEMLDTIGHGGSVIELGLPLENHDMISRELSLEKYGVFDGDLASIVAFEMQDIISRVARKEVRRNSLVLSMDGIRDPHSWNTVIINYFPRLITGRRADDLFLRRVAEYLVSSRGKIILMHLDTPSGRIIDASFGLNKLYHLSPRSAGDELDLLNVSWRSISHALS